MKNIAWIWTRIASFFRRIDFIAEAQAVLYEMFVYVATLSILWAVVQVSVKGNSLYWDPSWRVYLVLGLVFIGLPVLIIWKRRSPALRATGVYRLVRLASQSGSIIIGFYAAFVAFSKFVDPKLSIQLQTNFDNPKIFFLSLCLSSFVFLRLDKVDR